MNSLYASITGTSNILSVTITSNHDAPIASATIEAYTTSLALGDEVTIDLGYTDNHAVLMTGYVKQVEKSVPENTYTVTILDKLVRAQDFFIASSNPEAPLSKSNITAEQLVADLMGLAGLTVSADPTLFTFGVLNPFEINLVSSYDYCRTVADLLTWSFWSDASGVIQFRNRKPYVMLNQYPENAQAGFVADPVSASYVLTPSLYMDSSYTKAERNLRNRVVVYGAEGIYAEATEASPALPAGFVKSTVLAAPQLVDNQALAESIADYNLDMLHRITEDVSATVIGNPSLTSRSVIEINDSTLGLSGVWYLYGVDHQWSQQGYTCGLTARRQVKPT